MRIVVMLEKFVPLVSLILKSATKSVRTFLHVRLKFNLHNDFMMEINCKPNLFFWGLLLCFLQVTVQNVVFLSNLYFKNRALIFYFIFLNSRPIVFAWQVWIQNTLIVCLLYLRIRLTLKHHFRIAGYPIQVPNRTFANVKNDWHYYGSLRDISKRF